MSVHQHHNRNSWRATRACGSNCPENMQHLFHHRKLLKRIKQKREYCLEHFLFTLHFRELRLEFELRFILGLGLSLTLNKNFSLGFI